jgi:DNA-binding GntR family transcriptional regulator
MSPSRSVVGTASTRRATGASSSTVNVKDEGASSDSDLVNDVVKAIQERIASGQLPVGTWLRQERLAQELGVSRMPVREALRQLQAVGTLEFIPNRGARVRLPSTRDIVEVYEIRGLLEGHAAATAARLIDADQMKRLREADTLFRQVVVDLRAAPEDEQFDSLPLWHEANSRFHEVIVEASGNKNLADAIETLHRKIPRNLTALALGNDIRLLQRNADEHAEILAAVDRGDADEARHLIVAHAERARDLLIRKLDEQGTAS